MGGSHVCKAHHVWMAIALLSGSYVMSVSNVQAQRVAAETPATSASRQVQVTLTMKDAPLGSVLQAIASQAGLDFYYRTSDTVLTHRVSIDVRDVLVHDALANALTGTGFRAVISAGSLLLTKDGTSTTVAQGSVMGKVVDGKTRHGLRGATVSLSGTDKRATTGDDGGFRLSGITPGSYTLQVRMLGYVRTTKSVTIVDGETASVEVALAPSVNALDQVVVTGTVVATAKKAVPVAMTVVTAKQIEERGITRIDQLFRGDIPGLFVPNIGSGSALDSVITYSRGATTMQQYFDATSGTAATTPMRTYVDGVELARPEYLTQIDPRSIERIEILTGPQASTIYGSNAINGVIQIFTKRGTSSRPEWTVNLSSGLIQSDFSPALSPMHAHDARVSGADGRWAYQVGGSWDYMGKWTPAKQTTRTSAYGGLQIRTDRMITDVSLRRGWTVNQDNGGASQLQPLIDLVAQGTYSPSYEGSTIRGLFAPRRQTLQGQTMGITVTVRPTTWWTHELTGGSDVSDTEIIVQGLQLIFPSDSLRSYRSATSSRTTMRYSSTAQFPVSSLAALTLTAGVDGWRTRGGSLRSQTLSLTGTLPSPTVTRSKPERNVGGFIQGQLGLRDAMFVTYGLRAEWNPNYGDNAQPNFAPRIGAAYTRDIGMVTAKVRASYGRSTRPPEQGKRLAIPEVSPVFIPLYGPHDVQLANPDLGPEYQQGGEGGLELFLGNRASLIITRYNQTVDDLIAAPAVDSVRSLLPNSAATCFYLQDLEGYCWKRQTQYLNFGNIRNQGWELQGSLRLGPITTRGTYSWTKSRVIGILSQYRSFFRNTATYQPGYTYGFLPEHTWATNMTYARAGAVITVAVNGIGQMYTGVDQLGLLVGSPGWAIRRRLDLLQPRIGLPTGFRGINKGYVTADINASQRLSPAIEGVIQVQNATNFYQNDVNAGYASIGRQMKLGLRLRWI